MRLEAIAGQPRAVEQLSRALEGGRVAHAYAFVGPAGAGRFTTALAFASELLGADATRGHPDLHVVTPTPPESNPKGARTIRIGAIRELERRASLRPALAARRVLILDEAERMTDDAPQAFLKFLEEPPPATVVILILPRARAVPPRHGVGAAPPAWRRPARAGDGRGGPFANTAPRPVRVAPRWGGGGGGAAAPGGRQRGVAARSQAEIPGRRGAGGAAARR